MKLEKSKVSYPTLCCMMREFNKVALGTDEKLLAVIVFKEESFLVKDLPVEARSYVISNNNKAFIEGMGGYSIFGSSLDGEDVCVRLDCYMTDERGGENGWLVDYCYFV